MERGGKKCFIFIIFKFYRASSPLAQLYSTSTMEHHHFDQCIMILNSQGNQILGNVSSDEYTRIIKILEDAILSTDLAVYFRLGEYENIFINNWGKKDLGIVGRCLKLQLV